MEPLLQQRPVAWISNATSRLVGRLHTARVGRSCCIEKIVGVQEPLATDEKHAVAWLRDGHMQYHIDSFREIPGEIHAVISRVVILESSTWTRVRLEFSLW
jgi:hypothetical protein